MKKFINVPDNIVEEALDGFVSAFKEDYKKHPAVNGVIARKRKKNKVALVIGGGSGHEPMFAGFVGQGLADAAACGGIFASPDPRTIYETAKAVDQGKGVLFVYGCYAGDNLNFDMAEEILNEKGITAAHVRVRDDIASAPEERYEDRRGIAGDVFAIKIAGAVCDSEAELSEAVRITEKACKNIRSIGIAASSAQLPGMDRPIFELDEDEIEYGMGLHGEKGISRMKWQPADVLAEKMYQEILNDSDLKEGDEVCVLINGLGSATLVELAIVYRKVESLLKRDGIIVHDADLNNYCTSQEMGGFSITLMKLDGELKNYYDMPCRSPYYTKGKNHPAEDSSDVRLYEEGDVLKAEQKPDEEKEDAYLVNMREHRLETLNSQDVKDMLIYVSDKIIRSKPYLTEIDSAIGDGDHGIGMERGMKAVIAELSACSKSESVYDMFEKAGEAMLISMGGASGVIFGSMFLEGTKNVAAKSKLSSEDLFIMMEKSLKAIQDRGKAAVGDKTMVDALAPAVEAMKVNCGKNLLIMLEEAEEAAKQGVEKTKLYKAKFGRAKSLGERAIGFQDAGATSVWLILQGMREFVEGGMH